MRKVISYSFSNIVFCKNVQIAEEMNVNNQKRKEFESMTSFDLAFNIAMKKYEHDDMMLALDVIKGRDVRLPEKQVNKSHEEKINTKRKLPLKGSKAERIYKLALEGKTPQQCFEILQKGKQPIYQAEIYRVFKNYGFTGT